MICILLQDSDDDGDDEEEESEGDSSPAPKVRKKQCGKSVKASVHHDVVLLFNPSFLLL